MRNITFYRAIVLVFSVTQAVLGGLAGFPVAHAAPPTLTVSPTVHTLAVGQNWFFSALYDADGSGPQGAQSVPAATSWSSANQAIVNHEGFGKFVGRGVGTATITGTYQGLSGSATVTVIQHEGQITPFGGSVSGQGGTTLPGGTPSALTKPATNLSGDKVTLRGLVNPNNAFTDVYFEYGTTQYLGRTIGNQSLASGNAFVSVSATLDRLFPNTTYSYRVVARNRFGTSKGDLETFSTGTAYGEPTISQPAVTTSPATNPTANGATLNGAVVNGGAANVMTYFEYGTTQSLGLRSESQSVGANASANISATLGNLLPGTTYYFRAVADGSSGPVAGAALTVTTAGGTSGAGAGTLPVVETQAATAVGDASATFEGSVNPQGGQAIAWFEYGETPVLGTSVGYQSVGVAATSTRVSHAPAGLALGTQYYYRVAAQNGGGASYGTIANFRTTGTGQPAAPPAAPPPAAAPRENGVKPESLVALISLTSALDKSQPIVPTIDLTHPHAGDTVTYTVSYTSAGNAAVMNAILTVVAPPEVEFVSANPQPISANTGAYMFSLGTLAPKSEGTVQAKFRVKENTALGTPLTFVATLMYTNPQGKPQTVSGALTIHVDGASPAAKRGAQRFSFLAFLAGSSLGSVTFWLLLLIAVLAGGHFFYHYIKDKRAAQMEEDEENRPAITLTTPPITRGYRETAMGGTREDSRTPMRPPKDAAIRPAPVRPPRDFFRPAPANPPAPTKPETPEEHADDQREKPKSEAGYPPAGSTPPPTSRPPTLNRGGNGFTPSYRNGLVAP